MDVVIMRRVVPMVGVFAMLLALLVPQTSAFADTDVAGPDGQEATGDDEPELGPREQIRVGPTPTACNDDDSSSTAHSALRVMNDDAWNGSRGDRLGDNVESNASGYTAAVELCLPESASDDVTVNLSSYGLPSGNIQPYDAQHLFDNHTVSLEPGHSATLTAQLPACGSQLDLYTGDLVTVPPHHGPGFSGTLLAWTFNEVGERCGQFNLTSMCRPDADSGQLRVRNQSLLAQDYTITRYGDSGFEALTGTAGAGEDVLRTVDYRGSNDTYILEIAGHSFTKSIGDNPACTEPTEASLQITSMCQEPGENSEHVWRVRNANDLDVPFTIRDSAIGDGDPVGFTAPAEEDLFFTFEARTPLIIDWGDDSRFAEIAPGSTRTNANQDTCGYEVSFTKIWQDGEDEVVAPGPFRIEVDGEPVCELLEGPGDVIDGGFPTFCEGDRLTFAPGSTYTVTEPVTPDGWSATSGLGDVTLPEWDGSTEGLKAFFGDTTFGDGVTALIDAGKLRDHEVVNEPTPETPEEPETPDETDDPEVGGVVLAPEATISGACVEGEDALLVTLTLDNTGSTEEVEFTVTVGTDTTTITLPAGETETVTETIEPDDGDVTVTIAFADEEISEVFNAEDCTAEVAALVLDRGSAQSSTSDDVEVLGVSQTRMPDTGASTLLMSLIGLLSMAVGGGMLSSRRRTEG